MKTTMKHRSLMCRHPALIALFFFWCSFWCVNFLDLGIRVPSFVHVNGGDFDQYYAGAVVAENGWWDDLYPVQFSNQEKPTLAPLSPQLQQELDLRQAPARSKWIFPPPLAFLFLPLARLQYDTALAVHTVVSIAALLFLLGITERAFMKFGFGFFPTQIAVLLLGVSQGSRNCLISSNISLFVGLGVASSLIGIQRNQGTTTILGFLLAGMTKGSSVVWVPMLLFLKRWKTIILGAMTGFGILILTILFAVPISTYERFLSDVIPAGRGLIYNVETTNLSLGSAVIHFIFPGQAAIGRTVLHWCSAGMMMVLLVLFVFVLKSGASSNRDVILLAIFGSLAAYNLFANICWWHYSPQFFPLIPGLFAIARKKSKGAVLAFSTASAVPFFDPGFIRLAARTLNCHGLDYLFTIGLTLCMALSVGWLISFRKPNQDSEIVTKS